MDYIILNHYQRDIKAEVDFLKSEGCEAVYLFDSLATGNIHEISDIDLEIKRVSPRKIFRVYAKLDELMEKSRILLSKYLKENLNLVKNVVWHRYYILIILIQNINYIIKHIKVSIKV
ncbi:MAG: nucleotidyltransferase domain-containing protein [Candidatus Cloacimonetes bacterium]|nr:nucleotidyltransferase domain-containing protein [Candidatus Cloacimonadota bacterium]